MRLIILGSGTGIPSPRRSGPGALVQTDGISVLLDSASGTLQKLLEFDVTYKDIDIICYTHTHPDHVADLVPFMFACKYREDPRTKDLCMVGGRGFRDHFEGLRWVYGKWVEPETFDLTIKEAATDEFELYGIRIATAPMQHTPESVGFRLTSRDGKTICCSGDTAYCHNIVALANAADVLLVESSFPEGHDVPGHLTPALAGRIAREAHCTKVVLTHMYPPCDAVDVQAQSHEDFDGEVIIAEDMMVIDV